MTGDAPITVLLVDDQRIIVESVREMLEKEPDIRFHACLDARRALAAALELAPTVILQDLVMPGGNGLDLLRQYRSNEQTKDVPVVVLSVKEEPEVKADAFRLGANDYLVKLPSAVEMIARLRHHSASYVHAAQSRSAFEALRESREQLRVRGDEIRRQRDTLVRQARELEEKNAALGREIVEREALIAELDAFSHAVAHDLKNPVGALLYYSERLVDESESAALEDRIDWAKTTLQAGNVMLDIINGLLLLAQARRQDVDVERLDMRRVAESIVTRHQLMIDQSGAKVTLAQSWPEAVGYQPWVEEVWSNYFSNAIKYGGAPPEVELGGEAVAGAQSVFWVRDNGKGLSAEQRGRLFVPFTRLHGNVAGHGLGLSIVQRIVTRLGGSVDVVSPGGHGRGSEFRFTLPAA